MEEMTNSMNMTRRSAVKGLSVAALGAAVGALSLAGCAGGKGGEKSATEAAPYYRLPEFLSADGAAQLAELKDEGIAYFDQNGSWSWGGSPNDNPLSGPVWLTVHSVEQDDNGLDTMSREDIEANKDISWADLNWVEVPYTAGEEEATLSAFLQAAGFDEAVKSGWTFGNMSYGKVLSCRFEDVDGYGFLEMVPTTTADDNGDLTTGDTCQIRLACFRLDGSTMDEVAENLLPDETPTVVDENGIPGEEESAKASVGASQAEETSSSEAPAEGSPDNVLAD